MCDSDTFQAVESTEEPFRGSCQRTLPSYTCWPEEGLHPEGGTNLLHLHPREGQGISQQHGSKPVGWQLWRRILVFR